MLNDELANDPLGRGYDGMTDLQAATDLNTVYRTRYRTLDARDLLRWGFAREGLSKLRDAADRDGAFADISDANRAKAIAAYATLTQGIDGSLDLSDPEVGSILDQLITAGIFVAQDKTDLQTRATENISRADELNLRRVREGSISQARAQ